MIRVGGNCSQVSFLSRQCTGEAGRGRYYFKYFLDIGNRRYCFKYISNIALCGYPLVKMELEIQTKFLPRLPFSCNSIISDKIWRKMSLLLSIFLVSPQISLVKYYETIKILMQIFWYFRSHFHNVAGPGEKSYFEVFFSA